MQQTLNLTQTPPLHKTSVTSSTDIENVLSLFDGMSCGQLALKKAGIKYKDYYASEIDKDAIKVTMKNYPKTKQIGSVIDIKGLELPKIDLLIGGSPCQSFSNAGNGKGFDGKSGLFWEYVRILKEVKPTYFLLENVKMKKEWQNIISEALGVEPIEINSKYFVPQNRPRLYWTNIKVENIPTTFYHCINDILENASNEYYLTEKQKSILDLNFKWSENEIIRHKAGKHQQDNIFRYDGIMGCLSASTHGAARHLTKTYLPNGKIRRLTENEVEKLQGVPINYTDNVSSSKRYEMLGNGWTVDVIAHIFAGLS
jgi:DNA-cytosine methyltransferase